MFQKLNILDEKNKILREISNPVVFPMEEKEKKLVSQMIQHLTYSQIEEKSKQYRLRPGMGLAFPQLGILKRVFVVVEEYEKGKFHNYVIVNPIIVSHSAEKIAADAGEGCLSVNRDVEGHVPRYARVTFSGFDLEGNPIKIRVREDVAIAFQHELDHLNGILFFDHINPKHPFYSEHEMRLI